MEEVKDIRKTNINTLSEKYGRDALASKLGYPDTVYINQLCRGHGSFGGSTARKIEAAFDLPNGWMDQPHKTHTDPKVQAVLQEIEQIVSEASDDEAQQILQFARFSVSKKQDK